MDLNDLTIDSVVGLVTVVMIEGRNEAVISTGGDDSPIPQKYLWIDTLSPSRRLYKTSEKQH